VSRPSVFPLFVPSIIATAANLEFAVFMCFRVDLMDDFKVEIDVLSYLKVKEGRRVYTRGKTWDLMAGRNLSVVQINAALEEKFMWSNDQRMTIWYGPAADETAQLISESEIAELFDRCSSTKIVWFGVTIESKEQHKEPAPIIAEKDDVKPPIMSENDDDQPVHAPFFAWPKQAYAGEYEDDEPV
jgi:hypothetical protein